MNVAQIAGQRLASLQLTKPGLSDPEQVVSSLCGVRAQDYAGAKWSIGLRLSQATDAQIEQTIVERKIVRTWAMRGTLHFVTAADISWLLDLLAPGIIAGNARRYRQLELDDAVFESSNQVIEKSLIGGKQLTRAELVSEWSAVQSQLTVETSAHFLPPFDEYLLGYKDRTAAVKVEQAKRINAGGGMPKPTVI